MPGKSQASCGYTIIELLISLAIAALLLTAVNATINVVFETQSDTASRNDALSDARFAMQRMVTAVLRTNRLLLPLADNPNTDWREDVREQTVPASPPEGSSTLATAVLAVTLDPWLDIDRNGVSDADNDADGRIDEDLGGDNTNDAAPGIIGIDDDGDGNVDESNVEDDDEDEDLGGGKDEDPENGIDDDGDGAVDEDIGFDMNDDGQAGIAGLDDDGDGAVDEANDEDDDEDEDDTGNKDEDWFDPVVFFLAGTTLIERRPNLAPADGADYSEYPIAENVTYFRVQRIAGAGKRAALVDITLEVGLADAEPISVNTRVRVGGER